MNINTSLFQTIYGLAHRWWVLDWLGIFFASYLGYFLILAAILLLIKEKSWRQRIYFFSLSALSIILARGIITEIIRFFYYQPRPFVVLSLEPLINHDITSSFPSGHAAAYFALSLTVFYLNRQWGSWFLGLALLMGLARIFVGVHWPLDILFGAIIGLGSAFLIKKILPPPQTTSQK